MNNQVVMFCQLLANIGFDFVTKYNHDIYFQIAPRFGENCEQ
jgi:hypothetical protein